MNAPPRLFPHLGELHAAIGAAAPALDLAGGVR